MAEAKDTSNHLKATLFGTFSLTYHEKAVTGKSKTSENQFNYLMQLMSHYGREGVSKNLLISTLFGDRELNNANHALQSVLYNAKKRFQEYGIRAETYFERQGGNYYWTEEIPIDEDARAFEDLVADGRDALIPFHGLKGLAFLEEPVVRRLHPRAEHDARDGGPHEAVVSGRGQRIRQDELPAEVRAVDERALADPGQGVRKDERRHGRVPVEGVLGDLGHRVSALDSGREVQVGRGRVRLVVADREIRAAGGHVFEDHGPLREGLGR